VHVTLRLRDGLPRLRSRRLVAELRWSFGEACERDDFRLVHYSIQHNHVHLLVEAKDQVVLAHRWRRHGLIDPGSIPGAR
jgi:REP element-mobilizing transposase RayT